MGVFRRANTIEGASFMRCGELGRRLLAGETGPAYV